jgi:hypothetical protein
MDMSQTAKKQREQRAADDFPEVEAMAAENNIVITQCSAIHYQLRDVASQWLINLYVTTGKIVIDPNRPVVPSFELPDDWTLAMAVGRATQI